MLVLTRKVGEEIVIGGDIRITVTDIGNGRVKIGVTAPRDVHIVRSELEPHPAVIHAAKTVEESNAGLERILANRAKILAPHLAIARERIIDAPRISKAR